MDVDFSATDAFGTGSAVDLDVGGPADNERIRATQKIGPEDLALPDLEPVTMSEVGTKLDLARAYMDMGDPDGARSILKEVLQEGSVSQKQEAQRLIDAAGLSPRRLPAMPRIAVGVDTSARPISAGRGGQGNGPRKARSRRPSAVAAAPVSVTCAGRTDAGVHALGGGAFRHGGRTCAAAGIGRNTRLPPDIALTGAPDAGRFPRATARSRVPIAITS